jgi:hypothetical protein
VAWPFASLTANGLPSCYSFSPALLVFLLEEEEKMYYFSPGGVRTKMEFSPALLVLIEEEEKMCYSAAPFHRRRWIWESGRREKRQYLLREYLMHCVR